MRNDNPLGNSQPVDLFERGFSDPKGPEKFPAKRTLGIEAAPRRFVTSQRDCCMMRWQMHTEPLFSEAQTARQAFANVVNTLASNSHESRGVMLLGS